MEAKDLKLYEKYKHKDSEKEYIYIGIDCFSDYIFLSKKDNEKVDNDLFSYLFPTGIEYNNFIRKYNPELNKEGDILNYDLDYDIDISDLIPYSTISTFNFQIKLDNLNK